MIRFLPPTTDVQLSLLSVCHEPIPIFSPNNNKILAIIDFSAQTKLLNQYIRLLMSEKDRIIPAGVSTY